MKPLKELVALRQVLPSTYSSKNIVKISSDSIQEIINIDDNTSKQVSCISIINSLEQVKKSAMLVDQEVATTLAIIDNEIEILAAELFPETPKYVHEFNFIHPGPIREFKRLYLPDSIAPFVKQSIDLYCNWQYPGLEIGCRDGEWTTHLVGCDPLYVVDQCQEFLDNTVSLFPLEYQRRICPYLIEKWAKPDHWQDMDFSVLPQGQFGFIFSWNFFNYITLGQMKIYLTQIFALLRPGGTLMFSYNNTEMIPAVTQAMKYFMTWVPKTKLIELCSSIGFEVTSSTDFEQAISWIEIRKPGTLETIKLHQALGEIKYVQG